ncbi:PRC-barrel domain containing protein [Chromohalobacter sp. HP20-39]|uniref:PRC-barrel domain containing protein n=1 Tax=Chromohalobacter sp. HP20-39 TaxID=3079306 RepID=UPI00294A9D35|nr:PRC-barrel domain containing protein [Chromohalobacter sp. HP20-39]MDV6319436.1 PRC-barrel domain containing protein [Chromohalobacter sp. HP20-39]
MRHSLNRMTQTAILIGGLSMTGAALAQSDTQPQGLYSADELMDADVFLSENPNEDVGDVEDVLLGEDMSVQALVIETGGVLDLGDTHRVIDRDNFTLSTQNADNLDNMDYRVTLNLTRDDIATLPEYDNDWWQNAQQQARQAWKNTKQGAESAWQSTKSATADLLDDASDALSN